MKNLPVYFCPYCGHNVTDEAKDYVSSDDAMLFHLYSEHRDKIL